MILNTAADAAALTKSGLDFTTMIADLREELRQRAGRPTLAYARRWPAQSNLPSGRTTYRDLIDYQTEMKALADTIPAVVQARSRCRRRPSRAARSTASRSRQRPRGRRTAVPSSSSWASTTRASGRRPRSRWSSRTISRTATARTPQITDAARQGARRDRADPQHRRLHRLPRGRSPTDTYSVRRDPSCRSRSPATDNCGDLGRTVELGVLAAAAAVGARRTGARTATASCSPPACPCELQNGVDPNRNYGEGWGGIGASSDPYDQTYRGDGPWSEPETQAVHEFSQTRQVTNLITLHNVAALVLRPPGRTGRPRARRAAHEGARRRDGGRHRLHVAVRLAALRHLGHHRGLELRRRRARSATRSSSAPVATPQKRPRTKQDLNLAEARNMAIAQRPSAASVAAMVSPVGSVGDPVHVGAVSGRATSAGNTVRKLDAVGLVIANVEDHTDRISGDRAVPVRTVDGGGVGLVRSERRGPRSDVVAA